MPSPPTREHGWSYGQGAADDEESWSHKLTATDFWQHRTALLKESKEALNPSIQRIKQEQTVLETPLQLLCIHPNIYVGNLHNNTDEPHLRIGATTGSYTKITIMAKHADMTSALKTHLLTKVFPVARSLKVHSTIVGVNVIPALPLLVAFIYAS